jgi:16S rRNA (cytidine1402-2'-O)-methyltransferase
MATGKLYLIPAPLGEAGLDAIPAAAIAVLHRLDYFIVERAKTARHYLKAAGTPKPLPSLIIHELHPDTDLRSLLSPLQEGHDIGVLSEAGCPGIADPGAALVRIAHQWGFEVVPLSGPSAIVLAVMASGMNGQSFCFHGYLSAKRPELERDLKRLEQAALKQQQTQVFIETPYRNGQVIEVAMKTLSSASLFGIACNLTLPSQYIRCLPISQWRQAPPPDIHKRPAVFLLGAP